MKEDRTVTDRTTKFLLIVIALALWGLLLRPSVTPIPALAQEGGNGGTSGGMVVTDRDVYLRVGSSIFRFERNLQLKDQASYDIVNGQPKYVHQGP
jgi:hypothetical protein